MPGLHLARQRLLQTWRLAKWRPHEVVFALPRMVVLAAAAVWAQRFDAKTMAVRGEIVSSDGNVGSLSVELCGDGSGMSETVAVNLDGSFEFHSTSPGTHELRVIAANGAVIHQEYVSITSPNQMLSIRLTDAPSPTLLLQEEARFLCNNSSTKYPLQRRRPTRRANRPPPKAIWRRLAPTFKRLSRSTRSSPTLITTWARPGPA